MGLDLKFCTYNMGFHRGDWGLSLQYHNIDGKTYEDYNNAEESTKQALAEVADVYFLQEVCNPDDRPLTSELSKNFEIVGREEDGDRYDPIIAISSEKFKEIEDLSFQVAFNEMGTWNKNVTVAKAVEISTQNVFLFVSEHAPGFGFRDVDVVLQKENHRFQAKMLTHLKDINADITVIGGDLNNNPEKYPETFDVMNQHGYSLIRSGMPTNVNIFDGGFEAKRELDFFFAKSPTHNLEAIASVVEEMDVTENKNCQRNASDHSPVLMMMTIKEKKGFCQSFLSFLSFLFFPFRQLYRIVI